MSFSTRILFTQNYIMEGDNMHILIIEDEEQLCRSVAEGLRIDGYETDICFDGDEGLCLCMTENYDLILLDLNLPGTDGLEILR